MHTPAKQTENQATKPTATNGSFFGGRSGAPFFQAKLTVNEPGDAHEQEADRVSDQVMRMKEDEEPVVQRSPLTPVNSVQRMCADCEEKQEAGVQRKETAVGSSAGQSAPPIVSQVLSSGGGQQMDTVTRQFMESRFGQDFGQVRIHTGSQAAESAATIQAKAYTSGRNIVFGGGEYRPESNEGRRLLAHELVHVGQQGGGERIQRALNDCPPERWRDFHITIYFRRRATEKTMRDLRSQISDAKKLMAQCCLRLKTHYDWRLLPGGPTFNYGGARADGTTDYSADADALGSGKTFDNSQGLPVLVVDNVPGSGGGVTVTSQADPQYKGKTYAVITADNGTNQSCNSLVHELWHVIGNLNHDPAIGGGLAECSSDTLNDRYCLDLRNYVAPMGDFPSPNPIATVQYA